MSERSFGVPAVPGSLKELDAQQSLFVASLLELGGGPQHGTEAALTAGYADDHAGAARAARILLKSPKISRAIKEGVQRRFDLAIAAAFNAVFEICTNSKAPANARIAAAQEILNRSSIGPIVSRSAILKAGTTVEELLDVLDAREKAESSAHARTIDGTATEHHDAE